MIFITLCEVAITYQGFFFFFSWLDYCLIVIIKLIKLFNGGDRDALSTFGILW